MTLPGMTQDDIVNGRYPWWLRALREFGFPTLMAIGLLYWMLTTLDTRLTAMTLQIDAMFRLQQQICVNTSETAEQRTVCWNPWR